MASDFLCRSSAVGFTTLFHAYFYDFSCYPPQRRTT